MIHNDPTTAPTLLFILCLAAATAAVALDSVLLKIALSVLAAGTGALACMFTARTRAGRGIGACALVVLGIAVAVALSAWQPGGPDMFFIAAMFPALSAAAPMFAVCCACVLAAGMEGRKIFLALCAAITVAVIPRFIILLLGGASLLLGAEAVIVAGGVWLALAVEIVAAALIFTLFVQLAKNYELVPGGGGGSSGGGISTDWSTF